MVRAAVVQATPVVLDGPASVEKACAWSPRRRRAASRSSWCRWSLPKGFVPIMPRSCSGHPLGLIVYPRWVELPRRLLGPSRVDADPTLAAGLGDAARRAEAWVAIRVNKRRGQPRPAPSGTRGSWFRARSAASPTATGRSFPTMHGRVFSGQGRATTCGSCRRSSAKPWGLICWEDSVPTTAAPPPGGDDVCVAPTGDDRDISIRGRDRTFAFEASTSSCRLRGLPPAPRTLPRTSRCAARSPAARAAPVDDVDPSVGDVLAGPVHDRGGCLYARLRPRPPSSSARRVLDTPAAMTDPT